MLLRVFVAAMLAASALLTASVATAAPGNCRLSNGAVTRVSSTAACTELGGKTCSGCVVGAAPTTSPPRRLVKCRLHNRAVTRVSSTAACVELGGKPCVRCTVGAAPVKPAPQRQANCRLRNGASTWVPNVAACRELDGRPIRPAH